MTAEQQANFETRERWQRVLKVSRRGRDHDSPTLKQAMARADWPEWERAIGAELQQMVDEGVFEKTAPGAVAKCANIVGSMWVLQIKRKPNGQVDKYKARLVALGNQQREGSYKDISSGTARSSTIKMLISLQAKTGAHSMVLDVKGAYLKSVIDEKKCERLYLKLPNGNIVKLKKYLYGLKQAGYEWQQNITSTLLSLGYLKSPDDPLLFMKRSGKSFIIMSIHVDDFYVIADKKQYLNELYLNLVKAYGDVTIKEDDLLAYLGMVIEKDLPSGDIILSQPGYIEKLLSQVDLAAMKVPVSPFNSVEFEIPSRYNRRNTPVDQTEYLRLVGGLNYLAQYTRPDLLYALSRVAQQCQRPTMRDMSAVKRIMKYIEGTKHYGLRFSSDSDVKLTCHVDASYNCYSDGKGHYGYSFTLGAQDGAFYAKSAKLKIQTLSSTESEYVALCEAVKEVVYLRRILAFLGFPQASPTPIFEDNKSCIEMVSGNINHKVNKHINPKYHFSREQQEKGQVKIEFKQTNEMIADLLTKGLSGGKTFYFTKLILNL
jgi:hypothetical protein